MRCTWKGKRRRVYHSLALSRQPVYPALVRGLLLLRQLTLYPKGEVLSTSGIPKTVGTCYGQANRQHRLLHQNLWLLAGIHHHPSFGWLKQSSNPLLGPIPHLLHCFRSPILHLLSLLLPVGGAGGGEGGGHPGGCLQGRDPVQPAA